ncbi:HNH endonuclease [Parasediminibacterium sp. JCM 36343]|uniref:HNH endonuclease n=1 Tax=Parasediminibacterium sp. JCM 36343 TaxID=3374279 RepID=UPI003978EC9B
MLNINCPERDASADIDTIITEKYSGSVKTILQLLKAKIKTRYSDYAKIELNQRLIKTTFTDDEKKALKHLYGSQTTTAKKIIDIISKALLQTQAGCCVSCGIGDVDQIDHFLPQEHFPEYSILHKNLIPICGLCNEIKSDNIPGEEKNYFHPMFDKLPDEPFFRCQITYVNNIPTSKFSIIPKFHTTIVNNHFVDLKLKVRLEKKATIYFVQMKDFKTKFGDDFANEEIDRDLMKLGALYGSNYWKCILCLEMRNSNFVANI